MLFDDQGQHIMIILTVILSAHLQLERVCSMQEIDFDSFTETSILLNLTYKCTLKVQNVNFPIIINNDSPATTFDKGYTNIV